MEFLGLNALMKLCPKSGAKTNVVCAGFITFSSQEALYGQIVQTLKDPDSPKNKPFNVQSKL